MKSLLPVLFVAAGCAGHVRVQPEAAAVHRVAVVSTYANKDVYNVKNPDTNAAAALLKAALPTTEAGELERITSHAAVALTEGLSPTFDVVPIQEVVADPAYRTLDESGGAPADGVPKLFAKLAQSTVATPPGMVALGVDQVIAPRGTVSVGSEKQAREAEAARLGALATELDVDAVALMQLDLAYQPSGLFTFSFLGRTSSKAKPSVATTVVLVDRQGRVVLDTPLLERGGAPRQLGKGVWMIQDGRADLTQKSDKVVASYQGAVDAALADFEKRLVKKLPASEPSSTERVDSAE